jgi:hypothetical protein
MILQVLLDKQECLMKRTLKRIFESTSVNLRLGVMRKLLDVVPVQDIFKFVLKMGEDFEPSAENLDAGATLITSIRSFTNQKAKEFEEGNLTFEEFGEEVEGEKGSVLSLSNH